MARGWRLVASGSQRAATDKIRDIFNCCNCTANCWQLESLLPFSLSSTSRCHCAANWGSCTDVLWAALPILPGTKYLICCTGRAEAETFVRFVLAVCPIVRNIAHTPHIAMQLQIFFYCTLHSFVSLYCAASAA